MLNKKIKKKNAKITQFCNFYGLNEKSAFLEIAVQAFETASDLRFS